MCYQVRTGFILAAAAVSSVGTCRADESPIASGPKSAAVDRPTEIATPLVRLAEPMLTESSGLAVSRRSSRRYWSHNDSGGKPELFAFDSAGRKTGRCRLMDAKAVDWEDMACFRQDGVSRILVADCGDNLCKRGSITLYLLDEPHPDRLTTTRQYQTLCVTYPDGPQDCEAVAVDAVRGQIILIAKTALPLAGIYTTPLPPREKAQATQPLELSASRIGTLPLPMASAMDLDPNSGDVWIVNYFHGFCFPCRDRTGSLAEQLSGMPRGVALPKWKQIEAVAVDDEHGVWLTSEGSLPPLAKLKL
jgi:hypothetical protein